MRSLALCVLVAAVLAPAAAGGATALTSSVSATKFRGEDGPSIWIPVEAGATGLTKGAVVGAVTGDGDRGVVTYVEAKPLGGASMVGLAVSGLAAGSYKGTVDLQPGSDRGDVSVALTVKDPWWKAVGALLVVLALALALQRLARVSVTRRRLRGKASAIAATYAAARAALAGAPGDDGWKRSTIEGVPERIAALRAKVDEQTKGARVSIDDKVVSALDAKIDAVDAQVASFAQFAVLLPPLHAALDALHAEPLPPPPKLDEPKLATAQRRHLEEQVVELDDVARLLGEFAAARTAVAGIAQLKRRITSLGRQLAEIEQRDGHSQVENAQADLRSVWYELWTTEDPARLPELDDRLDGVEDEIAALWARPPKLRLQSTSFAPSFDGVTVVPPAIRLAPPSAPDPVAVARHDVHVARLLEGVVVLVAGLVAVVTALGTLYVGKPFGTVWDYLALATWALATPVAVAALGAALDNLGALEALQRRLSAR